MSPTNYVSEMRHSSILTGVRAAEGETKAALKRCAECEAENGRLARHTRAISEKAADWEV